MKISTGVILLAGCSAVICGLRFQDVGHEVRSGGDENGDGAKEVLKLSRFVRTERGTALTNVVPIVFLMMNFSVCQGRCPNSCLRADYIIFHGAELEALSYTRGSSSTAPLVALFPSPVMRYAMHHS